MGASLIDSYKSQYIKLKALTKHSEFGINLSDSFSVILFDFRLKSLTCLTEYCNSSKFTIFSIISPKVCDNHLYITGLIQSIDKNERREIQIILFNKGYTYLLFHFNVCTTGDVTHRAVHRHIYTSELPMHTTSLTRNR